MPFDDSSEREIAEPLGADFHFGLPTEQATRVAALWPAEGELDIRIADGRAAVMGEFSTMG